MPFLGSIGGSSARGFGMFGLRGPNFPPTGLMAAAASDTSVLLSWTNGDTSASTQIYRDSVLVQTVNPGVSTFTNSGLTRATNYTFTIRHIKNAYPSANTAGVIGRPIFNGSGGTVYTFGGYRIHRFDSSGTFTVTSPGAVDVLAVGGGGGGGPFLTLLGNGTGPGGGGGGGDVIQQSLSLTAASYPIVIGEGGSYVFGGGGNLITDGSGNNTTAFGITAIGGGGGGYGADGGQGRDGASGGGGNPPGAGLAGYPGAPGDAGQNGGGGGDSGAPVNTSFERANGGPGTTSSYSGSAVVYGAGGGGGNSGGAVQGGAGGSGVGGVGGGTTYQDEFEVIHYGNNATPGGTPGSGGGGAGSTSTGGAGAPSNAPGAAGTVIVRYPI